MKAEYDYLFVTHLPAFYKVNLYNEIAKHCKVLVLFVAKSSTIRTPDFASGDCAFDYGFLNEGYFEKRSIFSSLLALCFKIQKIKYRKIVVGGWDLAEFWFLAFISPRNKNCLALESSIHESNLKGFRLWLKKLFVSRMSLVFPSGEPHQALLQAIKYNGKTQKTKGVGIFNYSSKIAQKRSYQGKYLYVGRFAPEKNLKILLEAFQQLPELSLTLVGGGSLREQLVLQAPKNVQILDHIPNTLLAKTYKEHDVFILPSDREPWGLVVEEALFYGMPVIVSDKVGCATDLIINHQVGKLFSPKSVSSLLEAITWVSEHYDSLCQRAFAINFPERDAFQVQQYLEALL